MSTHPVRGSRSARSTIWSGAPHAFGIFGVTSQRWTRSPGTVTSDRASVRPDVSEASSTRIQSWLVRGSSIRRVSPGPSSMAPDTPAAVRTRTTWLSGAASPPVRVRDVAWVGCSRSIRQNAVPDNVGAETHWVSGSPSTAAYGRSPRREPPLVPASESEDDAVNAVAPVNRAVVLHRSSVSMR